MPENENKVGNSFMTKLSTFIVDKRNLFFLLTIIMLIFSAFSRNWVKGESELAAYLPEESETRQALDAVCAALRLPTCRRQFPRDIGAERPCLNFHMGRSDGICPPEMPEAEYDRRMEQAAQLLEGRSKQLLRDMTTEMEAEAEALRFEQAAQLRDRIQAISALSKKQTVIAGLCADTDVWGVYIGPVRCGAAVLHIENGDLLGRQIEIFPTAADQAE